MGSKLFSKQSIHVGFFVLAVAMGIPAHATEVGQILVCYACQNSGNPAIDAALTANPGVASDGILFAFVNSSSSAIAGGLFSVSNASPADSFIVPTIAAGSTYILVPGVTSDSGVHASGGLFGLTGVQDTSDGAGGVSDSSMFSLTGFYNSLAITSTTAGTSTAVPGTFTAGDPGLIHPFRDNPANGSTSFLGLGPSGDGGCSNCYFGEVATLDTPATNATPEPGTPVLLVTGLGAMAWFAHGAKRRIKPLEGVTPDGPPPAYS